MSDEHYQQRQQRVKEKSMLVWPRPRMNAVLSSSLPQWKRQNHRGIWYGNTRSWSRKKVGVVQFIKGTWPNGERNLLEPHGVEFQVMATGFTGYTKPRV